MANIAESDFASLKVFDNGIGIKIRGILLKDFGNGVESRSNPIYIYLRNEDVDKIIEGYYDRNYKEEQFDPSKYPEDNDIIQEASY